MAKGNSAKYSSYKEAWERIKEAQSAGHYLEAITLEESIISDRLISYLMGVGGIPRSDKFLTKPFALFISAARKHVKYPILYHGHSDLLADIDTWRKERNFLIHEFVKSMPGEPTLLVIDVIEKAAAIAKTGAVLARGISDWHRKQLSLAKKKAKTRSHA
jgi:hypothetical protein